MSKLDSEVKEILSAFEKCEFRRSANAAREIEDHKSIAETTFRKAARINIRLSSRVLRALQLRALKERIPYQTLDSSVLHKFVDGRLVDRGTGGYD